MVSITTAEGAAPGDNVVSKNSAGRTIVQDSNGRTVYTSTDSKAAIQRAIDRTSSGSTALIKAGTYTLGGPINAKAGVTISGEGSGTVLRNGEIDVRASNVVIKSLKMTGTCHLVIMPLSRDISNVVVQDVSATVGAIESAFSVISNNYKVSNVQFIRDSVTDSGAAGFLLSGRAVISNVLLDSCKVIGSGSVNRYNDWVSGFILAQNAEVNGVKAINCEASNNWEDGFFLKPETKKTNVVLQNNVANNNGQKPNFQEGYGYLLDATVSMVGCTGTGNKGGLTNLATQPGPVTKGSSSIALAPSATTVQVGTGIKLTGTLSGAGSTGTSGISGASVGVTITTPSGSTVSPAQGATVTTDANGAFAVDYTPSQAGSYKLTATFAGNTNYDASSASTSVSATTAPAPVKGPSTTALSLASTSVETNKNMVASGSLTGTSGIAGATVSLKVTLPDGTTVNPAQGATVTTDSSGRFTMSYTPTQAGAYKFTATFAGNGQYDASTVTVSFNAVAPTAPAPNPTTSYDYIVSSNVVKTASGVTAFTGSSFTAALQWAVNQGGKVTYVPAGNYQVTAALNFAGGTSAARTTLVGDGDGTTGTVLTFTNGAESASKINMNGVSNCAIKKVRVVSGSIEMYVSGGTIKNFLFEDVTSYKLNINQPNGRHEASWKMIVLNNGVLDGISYYRCKAIEGGGVGFEPYGDFTGWVKNAYYEDCLASRLGLDSATRFNPWIVGFDIAESAKVENVKYLRCTAEYIWEAGFHCEPIAANNVVIQDCVANYCGQKPADFFNPEGLPAGPYFGVGYFWSPYQSQIHITLTNCQGTGNAKGDLYHDATTPNPLGYTNGDLPPAR